MRSAYTAYTNQFLRAFKQAPWRTQTQAVAAWSIVLLIIAVLGGLYLTVASRAATAGRDVQALEARKAELLLNTDELRAELAQLRSVTRMYNRARELGFLPAQPDQIEYLGVSNYPPVALAVPPPVVEPSRETATLGEWLVNTFDGLLAGRGGGQ